MTQTWYSLLFAHWRVPVEDLQGRIPDALELDTFDGAAWLGIVPFGMRQVRLRGFPAIPGTSSFLELNVRTYVHARRGVARPGVWFFSLDAASSLAVAVARTWFRLPYFRARMDLVREGESVRYRSRRTHRGAPPATFDARYGPKSGIERAADGSLEAFLTERYCLYTMRRRGELLRGDIHHERWPLRRAEAEFFGNRMAQCHGIALPRAQPLLHFVDTLDVKIWPLRRDVDGRLASPLSVKFVRRPQPRFP
jgi:hypothetical protein